MTHRLSGGDGVARVQFWLRQAAAGDVLVYHRGNLAAARGQAPVLADVAALLARAAAERRVALTQERLGRGGWLYCATRLAEVRPGGTGRAGGRG